MIVYVIFFYVTINTGTMLQEIEKIDFIVSICMFFLLREVFSKF